MSQKRAFVVKNKMQDSAPAGAVQEWSFHALNEILKKYWTDIKGSDAPPQIGMSMRHNKPMIEVPNCAVSGTYELETYLVADDIRPAEAALQ